MEFLVGADPEVFMFKDGKPVSAHKAVPGTKDRPYNVEHGAVQVDGMALEFNIDPAASGDEFLNNIENVMGTLKEMVPDYELKAVPVATFGKRYLKKQPIEALNLGCDPDFDAWRNGEPNPKPDIDSPFRTGAGHVHIGWTNGVNPYAPEHLEACIMLAKQLDFYLGLPSLFFDKGTKRRQMYGAPGAFRPKPYGVEYRVLSNSWLNDSRLIKWVYSNTIAAANRLLVGDHLYGRGYDDLIQEMVSARPRKSIIEKFLNRYDIPYITDGELNVR